MKYAKVLVLMLFLVVFGCDKQTLYSAFPPDDYFDPIFEVELEPNVLKYNGNLSHKYSGDYSISLSLERPNPAGYGYDIQALQVNCAFKNPTQVKQLQCGNSLLAYWGEESGISIGIYNIPEAAGMNETVSFTLEFQNIEELKTIFNSFGRVSLLIKKWSDL